MSFGYIPETVDGPKSATYGPVVFIDMAQGKEGPTQSGQHRRTIHGSDIDFVYTPHPAAFPAARRDGPRPRFGPPPTGAPPHHVSRDPVHRPPGASSSGASSSGAPSRAPAGGAPPARAPAGGAPPARVGRDMSLLAPRNRSEEKRMIALAMRESKLAAQRERVAQQAQANRSPRPAGEPH